MKQILALCSVLLAFALPNAVWATCEWHFSHSPDPNVPTMGPFVLLFDGAVSQVSASVPKGTILFSQTYTSADVVGMPTPTSTPEVTCTNNVLYRQFVTTTGAATGYLSTYQTGIPGVGLRITSFDGGYFDGHKTDLYNSLGMQFNRNAHYKVELVKTVDGPLTAGGTITGTIGEILMDQGGPFVALVFNMKTPIIIQPRIPTCTISTPDVVVSLDQKSLADFASEGSALGEKDFNVSLGCSGGDANTSTNMHMFLTDQTTQTNQSSILSLTPASTASGVGVQLLKGSTPIVFGQTSDAPTTDITRNIVVNTPTVDIPLKARYVRTGNMSAGSVTAIATFTVDYR